MLLYVYTKKLVAAPLSRRGWSIATFTNLAPGPLPVPSNAPKKKNEEEKEDRRLRKIAKLKEELRRGYFYELGQINRTKSKVRYYS